ncbi:MAG: hypothetical protein ACXAAO_03295 [Candidatus Thorarchaeota archaeon]|jgi:hypothetical protein
MAFEEDFGHDPSQQPGQGYTLNATGLVSRTFSLWTRNLIPYILIIGTVSAAVITMSVLLLYILSGTVGTMTTDPVSFLINLFALTSFPDITQVSIALVFALVAFVINAITAGAVIKYALEDYAGKKAVVGDSFSSSIGKLSRIVVVQLILTSIVTIIFTPALILLTRAMDVIDISDPLNPIFPPGSLELMMSAFGFLLIGGIFILYIQARLVPTLAIVLDTELSAIESLKKSWSLTSGNILHVLGGQFLALLVTIVFGLFVSIGVGAALLPIDLAIVIETVISVLLFSAFSLIFGVVLYRDLQSRSTETSDLPDYIL